MNDIYHRKINYIRVSVTDRCNLRCIYCKPAKGFRQLARAQILSYEEIIRLVQLAVSCGISKVRLTGGDPLVRRDIVKLVGAIARLEGVKDLSLTTNGILLDQMASDLYQAGLRRINVSLDSLKKDKYQHITGRDGMERVVKGIEKARKVGFSPIKINIVVIKGINDDEVLDLAKLSLDNPFHIRFIEFMPIGNDQLWREKKYLSCIKIKEYIEAYKPLVRTAIGGPHHSLNNGPAQMFEFKGASGKIGFISPLSNHFCPACNRIRLTADGKIRSCLFSNQEIDIRKAMRSGISDGELQQLLIKSIKTKPMGHNINQYPSLTFSRSMGGIGG